MKDSRFYDHMTDFANVHIEGGQKILDIVNDNISSLEKHIRILCAMVEMKEQEDKIMEEGREELKELENEIRNMED